MNYPKEVTARNNIQHLTHHLGRVLLTVVTPAPEKKSEVFQSN